MPMIVMTTSNSTSEKPDTRLEFGWRHMVVAARSIFSRATACSEAVQSVHGGPFTTCKQAVTHDGATDDAMKMIDRTRILTNRRLRGLFPSSWTAGNALVGLLAPEFRPTRPSHHAQRTAMAKQKWVALITLGYSGGAAPDLHRCSLFVGRFNGNNRPPTHT